MSCVFLLRLINRKFVFRHSQWLTVNMAFMSTDPTEQIMWLQLNKKPFQKKWSLNGCSHAAMSYYRKHFSKPNTLSFLLSSGTHVLLAAAEGCRPRASLWDGFHWRSKWDRLFAHILVKTWFTFLQTHNMSLHFNVCNIKGRWSPDKHSIDNASHFLQ